MIYRVSRFLIDGAMVICSSCKLRAATHSVGKQNDLCCECYVFGDRLAICKDALQATWNNKKEATVRYLAAALVAASALALHFLPSEVDAQEQTKSSIYVIILKLSPESTAQLGRPGVVNAVADAAKEGHAPSVQQLVTLGQTEEFARVFVERLGYLVRLKQTDILRAAGPFEDLKEGIYICNAADEREARRIMEEDPLYRAGFIEHEYSVRRWLAAI
jgi:uncharacterized protein YciI